MNALLVPVTCPTCAGPLTWRQSTRPMACAEAGYAEVIAYPSSLFDEVVSYSFAGAPDEVLYKAGDLVRAAFGMEAEA